MATLPGSPKHRDSSSDLRAQPSHDSEIDPEGIVDNMRHLLPLVSQADREHYSTTKRVRHLNELAKVIKYCGHTVDPYFPVEKVIENVRLALVSAVKEVRAGALRVLRYLLHSKEAFAIMLRLRIDVLVVRSLDVPPAREIERLQAVRFVRQAISSSPHLFPASLAAPLVSIVLYDSDPPDNLTWSALATLCELALLNPEVAARSGAIKAILKGLLKCQTPRISESIVLTLNFLLNKPESRKYIRSHLDLESLLAPITDLHYRCIVDDGQKTLTHTNQEVRVVQASKMAVVSMLKSWPGIFCLCSPHNNGITSLLNMLPLAQPMVQREILDIFYSVFQLKVPTWTDNFQVAITSIDPAQPKNEWSLTEGFVVEEGKDLLPPKYGGRTNLMDCFHALMLAVLMNEELFEHMVEVVRTANDHIRIMTTILMGELLHMVNTILPSEVSDNAHCLSDLIASAMAFDTQAERNRATEVISHLDRVHQQKKEGVKPSSLYLQLILEQSRYSSQQKMEQELLKHMPSELEETSMLGIVRDTNVLATKDFTKWRWNLIFSVLQHPSMKNPQLMEDTTNGRFIKRLCNFYKPSGHIFSSMRFSEANQNRYSTVGKLLMKYLCSTEEYFSGHLMSLLSDIVDELSQVTASKVTADVFSASSVANKMSRDYFLLLGTASFLRPTLLEQCKAYGPLLDICNYQNRSDLMKLILSTLDFGHNVPCRIILSKILTSTDKEMRLYATRHMRVLLRAKMPFFNSWGLELLVPQLYDLDRQVALEAVEILDEACEEENFLEALLLQHPALLHLGEKGAAVFTRFISIRRGFALLQKLGLLEPMMDRWYFTYSKLYVYIVEEKLAEALTSFKIMEEGEFIRRTHTSVIQPNAFVPVHFYGQLVQHEEGCTLLEKMGHIKKFCETIRQDTPTVKEDVTIYKAAIWALGHIGSTQRGLELLLLEGAVEDLVELAEECPLLSIRGTCYYSLCLISKTVAGANVLLDEHWITVRHSAAEKWPLIFEGKQELDDALPSSPDPPLRFFPPLYGSFDLNSLPRTSGLPKASSYQILPTPPYTRTVEHTGSSTALHSPSSSLSLRKLEEEILKKSSPRSLGRKTGKNVFASLKDKERRSPSLARLRGKSSADAVRGHPGALHTLSHSVGKPFSVSTGELLSPDKGSPVSQNPVTLRSTPALSFTGVCIPMDISRMFEYTEEDYKGCRTRTSSAPNFELPTLPHDLLKCLECFLTRRPSLSTLSFTSLQQHLQAPQSPAATSSAAAAAVAAGGSSGSLTPDTRSRSHTTESSTTGSGVGSLVSRDKTLDATPSPDAPRALFIHTGSSDDNLADGEVEGGKGTVSAAALKHSPAFGTARTRGSPLVRMKHVHSRESMGRGLGSGEEGEKRREDAKDENREMKSEENRDDQEDKVEAQKKTDSSVVSVTPPPAGSKELVDEVEKSGELDEQIQEVEEVAEMQLRADDSSSCEDLKVSTSPEEREEEEEEEEEEEGEEGLMTEDDETEDDEEEEEGEEGEVDKDDHVSQSKGVRSNVTSSSAPKEGSGGAREKSVHRGGGGGGEGDTADTVSVSSVMTTQSADEAPNGRQALHKAVLEIVYSLSSDVSLKKNSQGLNQVCQKYPDIGEDLCLYSKVVDMLSTYHYNLLTRRFIQSKFQHMTFDPLFAAKSSLDDPVIEDELMSSAATSAASSRRESYCSSEGDGRWRRRSSTSDVLRFRHRMQQMSSHESHEEIPNPEETNKQDDQTSTRTRTEPSITITTASMSSQESSVGLSKPSRVMSSVEDSTGSGRTTASSSAASSSHFNQHHQADTVPTTLAASSDSQLEPQASPDVGHSVIENTTYDL